MVESKPKKPKCTRCGNQHTVSAISHWKKGWFMCRVCNIRWAG